MNIDIEVIAASGGLLVAVKLQVASGSTVESAIIQSGLLPQTYLDLADLSGRVGIYGKLVLVSQILKSNDRVEIYSPLIADPKAVRRARARVLAR